MAEEEEEGEALGTRIERFKSKGLWEVRLGRHWRANCGLGCREERKGEEQRKEFAAGATMDMVKFCYRLRSARLVEEEEEMRNGSVAHVCCSSVQFLLSIHQIPKQTFHAVFNYSAYLFYFLYNHKTQILISIKFRFSILQENYFSIYHEYNASHLF